MPPCICSPDVAAWAHYEFDLYDTPDGRRYLTLMLRLQADREVSPELRQTLNCSEATVVRGFSCAWPALDRQAVGRVWRMASSALYAAVTAVEDVAQEQRSEESALARRRAIAFLLDGLRGYCDCPPPQSASAQSEAAGPPPIASVEQA